MKISCIMPTARRERFIVTALRSFASQNYRGELELIIFDDADVPLPDDFVTRAIVECGGPLRKIHYYKKRPGRDHSIGALRNLCCDFASGELIAHWDDDDWSSPDRLTVQVAALIKARVEITGLRSMEFFHVEKKAAWLYDGYREDYCLGTSLVYSRLFWHRNPFLEDMRLTPGGPPKNWGEDNEFLRGGTLATLTGHYPLRLMAARIHGACTSPKPVDRKNPETGEEIIPDEWTRLGEDSAADLGRLFA